MPTPTKQVPARRQEPERLRPALTVRSLLIGTALLFGAVLWVRHSELLVHTINLTEATPPVPAIAALLLLALLHPLLRRLGPRFSLTRPEMVLIYFFVAIGSIMPSLAVVRMALPCATVPFYFATPENNMAALQEHIPSWLRPDDREAIRTLWEASEAGRVPWRAWVGPALHWTFFLTALWATALCLTALLRKSWMEEERLSFPLLYLPLDITEGTEGSAGETPFFRDPVMWVGFLLAVVFNVFNIVNSFNPAVPALGRRYDIGALFTERPWSALQPLFISHRPEVVGLGYLVSLEVALSVWVFALAQRLSNVFAVALGWDISGFPFQQEQGGGAYMLIAILLLWRARGQLRAAARGLLGGEVAWGAAATQPPGERAEPLQRYDPFPPRLALAGLIVGIIVVLAWCSFAGMSLSAAALYLALLLGFAITYMRVRCETGTPSTWLFPWYQAKKLPLALMGAEYWLDRGGPQTLTIWSMLFFLSRGFFFSSTAYPLEGYKASETLKSSARDIAVAGLVAVALGLMMAWWMHLDTYYEYGGNVVESGGVSGGPRTGLTIREYQATAADLIKPSRPDNSRRAAVAVGAVIAGVLGLARSVHLRFPLHPLGYAMAAAYSYQIWGGFFVVWVLKSLIFKLGGVRMYKRLTPAFIGLALGHFFTMGIAWAIIGSFYGVAAERARVWFT